MVIRVPLVQWLVNDTDRQRRKEQTGVCRPALERNELNELYLEGFSKELKELRIRP